MRTPGTSPARCGPDGIRLKNQWCRSCTDQLPAHVEHHGDTGTSRLPIAEHRALEGSWSRANHDLECLRDRTLEAKSVVQDVDVAKTDRLHVHALKTRGRWQARKPGRSRRPVEDRRDVDPEVSGRRLDDERPIGTRETVVGVVVGTPHRRRRRRNRKIAAQADAKLLHVCTRDCDAGGLLILGALHHNPAGNVDRRDCDNLHALDVGIPNVDKRVAGTGAGGSRQRVRPREQR